MENIVVFITASNEEEAGRIARDIVESGLAACVNIIKGIRSIYTWQGRVEDETEALMVVKTRKGLFDELSKKVKGLHTYAVPEIIALPIVEGSEDYLKWLHDVTASQR